MPSVEIPDVGTIDFPDSMTEEQISKAIETDILKSPAKAEAPVAENPATTTAPPPQKGFLATLADYIGQGQAGSEELARQGSKEAVKMMDEPLVNVSPEGVRRTLPVLERLGSEGAQGAAEALAGTVTGLTTPTSIATLGAAAIAPTVVLPVLAGMGAKHAGEALGAQSVAADTGDVRAAARLGVEGIIAGAQAIPVVGLGTKAGARFSETKPVIEGPIGETVAKVKETLPETAKALEQVAKAEEKVVEPVVEEAAPQTPVEPPPTPAQQFVKVDAPSPEALRAVPESVAKSMEVVDAATTRLTRVRQGIRNAIEQGESKDDIVRKFDAADNEAKIEGQQVGNSVRLDLPSKLDREAVTFIVEAAGDITKLNDFLAKVEGKNPRAQNAILRAKEQWDQLKPYADRVDKLHEDQLTYERENGIDPGDVEGYIRHAYDMDALIGKGRPVVFPARGGGGGASTSFRKQRSFPTYADAIEAGMKPLSLDAADLVQSRVSMGERLVNRSQWVKGLSKYVDPAEGTPVVTELITQPKGTQVAPTGYVPREPIPGQRMAVHEGYVDLIDALTGTSKVQSNPIGRTLLKTTQGVKHGMLLFDTFHAGRILLKQAFMSKTARGHNLGRSLLEYSEKDLNRAIGAGEVSAKAAEWVKENKPTADLLISNGLNVGRISDALYKDIVKDIPLVGTFNKWVFDKLTRGAMMHSAVTEFARLRPQLPKLTEEQVAGRIAKDINTYYGNLGKQGVFKDATFQDLSRMVFLAPQWLEGMARTEIGAGVQAAKIISESIKARSLVVGSLAKAVGSGVLAAFIANQLVNLSSRGTFTWDNPEHGHQLDAYIPDVSGKGNGFFLSPLSVFAELTHDAIRYYEEDPHALKVAARITGNKFSPIMRAEEVLRTGKDFMGRNLDSTWDRVTEAGKALVPAPIPTQSLIMGRNMPPGSLQRQLTASLGIKTEPAPSAASQLYVLAKKFKESKGIKEPTREPSEYGELNNALRNDNKKEALKQYEKLVETKGAKTVVNHYRNIGRMLYTGKRTTEAEFIQSLSDKDRELLDKAREERAKVLRKFAELFKGE